MNDRIKEIEELNEKFYELYGALHENAALMTEKQVAFMGEKLHEVYKGEYMRIYHGIELENKREEFTHRARCAQLVPKVKHPWYLLFRARENRAAALILDEVFEETKAFFEKCEKALDEKYPQKQGSDESAARRSESKQAPPIPENGEAAKPAAKSCDGAKDNAPTEKQPSPPCPAEGKKQPKQLEIPVVPENGEKSSDVAGARAQKSPQKRGEGENAHDNQR